MRERAAGSVGGVVAAAIVVGCAGGAPEQRCIPVEPEPWPKPEILASLAQPATADPHALPDPAPLLATSLPDGPACEPRPSHVAHPARERDVLAAALDRALAAASLGGFPYVPNVAAQVAPGERGPGIAALRERLAAEGYPVLSTAEVAAPDLFDSSIGHALRLYQLDHGAPPTGALDRPTFKALDVPARHRVAQLRRAIALAEAAPPTGVRVNIPAFDAVLTIEGAPVMRTRTVVGAPYVSKPGGMTRQMAGAVHTMVAHPPWIPTPSYIHEILLPAERKRPGTIQRKGLTRIRTADGRLAYSMPPGPDNPLGQLILRFNADGTDLAVFYLHDTPEKHRFEEAVRTRSSGCVRTEHVDDLAAALSWLGGLDPDKLRGALADSGRSTTLRVPRPVPVTVDYSTADVGPDGRVRYHADVYRLDPTLLPPPDVPSLDVGLGGRTQ